MAQRLPFSTTGLGALVLGLWFTQAQAITWDLNGVIEECDELACGLADIAIGDTLAGFLKADDAAGGPNSTFTEADVSDFLIAVMELTVGPADGATLVSASVTTDGDGEIASGDLVFFGVFDGGIFGDIALDVVIDATAERFSVSTDFLGLGEIANGTLVFSLEPDGDGLAAIEDNCLLIPNPAQDDTNLDGIGNVCDADVNGDCVVNFLDLGDMKSVFFSADPDNDLAGTGPTGEPDGTVNFIDLGRIKELFFADFIVDNPSGVPNLCAP